MEKTLSRSQVLEEPNWYFAKKFINHEYFECGTKEFNPYPKDFDE